MNVLWEKIISNTILKHKNTLKGNLYAFSEYQLAKGYREFIIITRSYIKDFLLITLGIFSAAFGLKGFLLTNHFIDGGATGISLLISALTDLPLSFLIICINIPFVILGYKTMGTQFAIKTA